MLWRALGVVPLIRAGGPDVDRSAIGRAVAESIWLPTAVLPRYGVRLRALDDVHLVANIPIRGEQLTLQLTIDD